MQFSSDALFVAHIFSVSHASLLKLWILAEINPLYAKLAWILLQYCSCVNSCIVIDKYYGVFNNLLYGGLLY